MGEKQGTGVGIQGSGEDEENMQESEERRAELFSCILWIQGMVLMSEKFRR